jgi:hypothetical protein
MSIPYNYEMKQQHLNIKPLTESIINTYDSCLRDDYPDISLFQFMKFQWSGTIKYKHPHHPEVEQFIDYHPTPVEYANYLIACNIPITQRAIDYAQESLDKMLVPGLSQPDIVKMFSDCDKRLSDAFKLLW